MKRRLIAYGQRTFYTYTVVFHIAKIMNNNDIRNISKNFFQAILPNYMTFF